MDANWTFNSSSSMMDVDACAGSNWTWEDDKAFENALATYYNDPNMWDKITSAVPNRTIEDIKHRYEVLCIDVETIESGKVPVPDYPSNVSIRKGKKKSQQVQRGASWTEEEHRRFLFGLERFGRGDWRSIARFSVQTKSNSQVASHAQKYFKRLNSARKGKRLSINDIRSVNPEKLLAFEKATTSYMPGCCNENSTGTGTEEAAMRAGNQMLPEHTTEASVDGENQLRPEFPDKAPTETGNPLLQHGRPKKARTDASDQLLPPVEMPGHLALSSDEMAGIYNTDAVMQDADVSLDNEVETGCSPVNMELDLSLFPHFLD